MDENLTNLFLEKAHESMGMYPQATIKGDVRTERTPWQDGWNAALMKLTERWSAICDWYKAINEYIKLVLAECLLKDLMFLHVNDKENKISILVNMGDTFAYACADSEEVDITEVETVKDIYDRFGWDGVIAWASKKRKETPIEERITVTYKRAREYLDREQL